MRIYQLYVLGWLGLVVLGVHGQTFGLRDLAKSAQDIATGVAKDVQNKLPTPEGLFETGKNLIGGYPFEFVSSSINKICSSALSSEAISPKITPDINKMQFQLRANCKRHNFPLLRANDMWQSPDFDRRKKVVLLVTGWTTNVNETVTIDSFEKAFNCRGDANFVALDAASFVDTLYTWSAFNTEAIGEHVATGLVQLADIVPLENIHLIGHSLGAHIVGAAGRYFTYKTDKRLAHITGLDPAKPCFNEGQSLAGLYAGDADFVDVVHSNPGVLGKRDPIGDVDFYAGGLDPLPPGCLTVTCAHQRACDYYVETVYPGQEGGFAAKRCTSLTLVREGKCPGRDARMGYGIERQVRGNYFSEVRSEPPFGLNTDRTRYRSNDKCGECPK